MPVLVALLLSAQAPAPPVPVFGARVESVRVDVAVDRGGEPAEGLTAADFDVRDDGVRQAVRLVSSADEPVHAVLVLDASASVTGPRLADLKTAARAVLQALRPGDRATLLTFRDEVRLLGAVADEPARVASAVDGLVPGGLTALRDAVAVALGLAHPRHGRTLVIVFSDGFDRASLLSPEALLDAARGLEAVVHAVMPQPERAPPFLLTLAEETGGRGWPAESRDRLSASFLGALDEFRHRYVLEFEPKATPGWHRLEVRVKGARVLARKGYVLPLP
jgi:VWFA-related protein